MNRIHKLSAVTLVIASVVVAGCGSSSSSSSSASPAASSQPTTSSSGGSSGSTGSSGSGGSTTGGSGAGALSAEAVSAATGDIPDNQVFLVYHNPAGGYSMKYPEGWTIQGAGRSVTISNKNNVVHIVIAQGGAPSTASVSAELSALKHSNPTLQFTAPTTFPLPASGSAIKARYSTLSAPNPVTGKRVLLLVDRYALGGPSGRYAVVDLGTPKGVDNVDAYRKMIQSFTWQ